MIIGTFFAMITIDYLTNKKIIKKSLIDRKSDSSIRLKNVNVNNIKKCFLFPFNSARRFMCYIVGNTIDCSLDGVGDSSAYLL